MGRGYTSSELYVTTWGDRNPANALLRFDVFWDKKRKIFRAHSCETLTYLRKFTEAVMAYTKSSKIDMISHSMGVTLARKVATGGHFIDEYGNFNFLSPRDSILSKSFQ